MNVGVAPVLAFQGEAALARRLSLEGARSATKRAVVIEGRLVALNAAPVVGTAAEDAGMPRLPRAVNTPVAAPVAICAPEIMQDLLGETGSPRRESPVQRWVIASHRLLHGLRPAGAGCCPVGAQCLIYRSDEASTAQLSKSWSGAMGALLGVRTTMR